MDFAPPALFANIAQANDLSPPTASAAVRGAICTKCNEYAVFKVEGCLTCRSCGWSKCS